MNRFALFVGLTLASPACAQQFPSLGPWNLESLPSQARVLSGVCSDGAHICPAQLDSSNNLKTSGSGGGGTTPTSSTPTGFSASFTTTAAQALAGGTYKRVSFLVQGTGAGCYSFTSPTPTIIGTTCTNGYPVTGGSTFNSSNVAVPNTALTIIEASGAALTLYGDYQQ